MKKRLTCPKCSSEFDPKGNLKEEVNGLTSFISLISQHRFRPLFSGHRNRNAVDDSNVVVCPKCRFEFLYTEYKYFGILSPSVLKHTLIIIIITVFILLPVYILMRDLMR